MKFGLSDDEICLISKIIKQYPQIKSARVFGSRASGSFTKSSDIDLALVGDLSLELLASIKQDFIDSDLIYSVDVVDYLRASESLKFSIDSGSQSLNG